ncbi:class I SAM-dependent methyltransferase [Candidatus Pacearchaeota archaeon]|nr:class I SAM-dependent methyltransferase [Candidatus Pacearchaeota archaeon]
MKPDEQEAMKNYDLVAEHYNNWRTKMHPQGWIFNEHLEMPATFELLGNIKNKKVLDIGCGGGIYAKQMTQKGAIVKGFDISEEMLAIAKINNPNLDLRKGSFYKIPFKEKFDVAIAPLVIDYAKDWDKVFKEINSKLNKGGEFIFSVGNPVTEISEKLERKGKRIKYKGIPARVLYDYFTERKIYGTWKNILHKKEVTHVRMPTYHRTYESIIKIIIKNGFEIVDYKDCFPTKESKKLFPEKYKFLSKVPYFCVWKVKKK